MGLTVAEVRAKSLHERTKALDESQVQAVLDITEQILLSEALDVGATNYTTVFARAQLALFDWYLSNPNALRRLEQGSISETYSLEIPPHVKAMLAPIRISGWGEMDREGGA